MQWTSFEITQVVISVCGFSAVFYGFWLNHKALQTSVSLDFFRRYDEISKHLPGKIHSISKSFKIEKFDDEDKQVFLKYARRYLNLCSEEFALYSQKRIASDIWGVWSSEIADIFTFSAWKSAWKILREEYSSFPEFRNYIDSLSDK